MGKSRDLEQRVTEENLPALRESAPQRALRWLDRKFPRTHNVLAGVFPTLDVYDAELDAAKYIAEDPEVRAGVLAGDITVGMLVEALQDSYRRNEGFLRSARKIDTADKFISAGSAVAQGAAIATVIGAPLAPVIHTAEDLVELTYKSGHLRELQKRGSGELGELVLKELASIAAGTIPAVGTAVSTVLDGLNFYVQSAVGEIREDAAVNGLDIKERPGFWKGMGQRLALRARQAWEKGVDYFVPAAGSYDPEQKAAKLLASSPELREQVIEGSISFRDVRDTLQAYALEHGDLLKRAGALDTVDKYVSIALGGVKAGLTTLFPVAGPAAAFFIHGVEEFAEIYAKKGFLDDVKEQGGKVPASVYGKEALSVVPVISAPVDFATNPYQGVAEDLVENKTLNSLLRKEK